MQVPITALYAGLFALFALFLSFRADSYRGKTGVSLLIGAGGTALLMLVAAGYALWIAVGAVTA